MQVVGRTWCGWRAPFRRPPANRTGGMAGSVWACKCGQGLAPFKGGGMYAAFSGTVRCQWRRCLIV